MLALNSEITQEKCVCVCMRIHPSMHLSRDKNRDKSIRERSKNK